MNLLLHNLKKLNESYSYDFLICDCLSENRLSSHLPVFREIPF